MDPTDDSDDPEAVEHSDPLRHLLSLDAADDGNDNSDDPDEDDDEDVVIIPNMLILLQGDTGRPFCNAAGSPCDEDAVDEFGLKLPILPPLMVPPDDEKLAVLSAVKLLLGDMGGRIE